MYVRRRWQALIIAGAVTFFTSALVLSRTSLLGYFDNKSFDLLLTALKRSPPTNQTVIVDIDEASLARIGHWPWPRSVVADLVEKIHAARPSLVAVDIVFPEPQPADASLAKALSLGRSVIGFDFVFDSSTNRLTECPVSPAPLVAPDVLPAAQTGLRLAEASAAICDAPALSASAVRSGFLNALHDGDGLVRRAPLLIAYRNAIYPSFALSAAAAATPGSSLVLINQPPDRARLEWRGKQIAFSDRANLMLRYRGPARTLPHYSAEHVLTGRVLSASFYNKIVVIGSSAHGLQEDVETYLDGAFPAVEVQATIIDNLIAGDWFYHAPWAPLFDVFSIAGVALISVFILFRFNAPIGIGATLLLTAILWLVCGMVLDVHRAFVSPVPATIAGQACLALYAVKIIVSEGRMGRQSREELAVANRFITGALGAMTAVRDVETGQHVIRIQGYLRSLCEVMASRPRFSEYLSASMVDLLVQLAPIHDIGKVGVPDYVLRKPGALTDDEFKLMKSHVTLGKHILEEAREQSGLPNGVFFQTALDIVYSHHEWWDGSGYPLGISGDDIPIPGRLLAVADVYDALISKRHYKAEFLHAEAVDRIRAGAGNHFDPEIVEAFLTVQHDWKRMAESHRDEPPMAASAR